LLLLLLLLLLFCLAMASGRQKASSCFEACMPTSAMERETSCSPRMADTSPAQLVQVAVLGLPPQEVPTLGIQSLGLKTPKSQLGPGTSPCSPSLMQAAYRSRTSNPDVPELACSPKTPHSECSLGAKYSHTMVFRGLKELGKVTGEPGDILRDPELAYGESSLTFKDVSFSIKQQGKEPQRSILEPCSGHFEPGTLVALMGPSGSGKTTLLDILAGKKTSPYNGEVHLNGRPRDQLFRRLTSYVAQDDILFANVTVKEAVTFHTVLKTEIPSRVTGEMLRKATEMRLRAVGLEEVQDSRIGNEVVRGISGGQRRRVSLACGLATEAQIIFCDEPTSGLSSTDAETSVRFMRLLAKKFGITIIVAIHQPRIEVAKLFDHLLLLTANPGRVVYNGPYREAVQYWSNAGFAVPEFANPTDWFLDLVTPGVVDSQADHFVEYFEIQGKPDVDDIVQFELNNQRKSALDMLEVRRKHGLRWGDLPAVRNSVFGVRFRRQFRAVFYRQLVLGLRDQQGILTEFIVAVVKALVVGVAYVGIGKQDGYSQVGFYFMVVMTCALDGIKVMPRTIQERTIMKLETSNALYNDWAYILSFTIINTIVSFISNTIFVSLVFTLSQVDWAVFPTLFFWTTLTFLCMDSMYLMVGAFARDSTSAQIALMPFLMLFLVYNGFTVSPSSVPPFMEWALSISPIAHAMEEIVIGAQKATESDELALVVSLFGYKDSWNWAIGVMVICTVLFRTVQVVCLKTMNNIQR